MKKLLLICFISLASVQFFSQKKISVIISNPLSETSLVLLNPKGELQTIKKAPGNCMVVIPKHEQFIVFSGENNNQKFNLNLGIVKADHSNALTTYALKQDGIEYSLFILKESNSLIFFYDLSDDNSWKGFQYDISSLKYHD